MRIAGYRWNWQSGSIGNDVGDGNSAIFPRPNLFQNLRNAPDSALSVVAATFNLPTPQLALAFPLNEELPLFYIDSRGDARVIYRYAHQRS